MLLAGTSDGVYRASERPFESVECVLPSVTVRRLRTRDSAVFAATDDGLFRTTDGGDTWRALELPVTDVYAVCPTERALSAGARPAAILRSTDGGGTWTRLSGFERLAADSGWPTNPHHERARVRSLAVPPDSTGVLLAGVEVGGFAASFDAGATWQVAPQVPDDVHHVLPVTDERWVVSCGTGGPESEGGLFETRDGGETWTRRDTGAYEYVRESCFRECLYAAGNRTAPLWTPADAALFVERAGQDGQLERVPYPGEPTAFVISWATVDDAVLAGTNDGRILCGDGETWRELGTVPVGADSQRAFGVRSLAVV